MTDDFNSFSTDQTIARLTGLTLNPETPPHQPHNHQFEHEHHHGNEGVEHHDVEEDEEHEDDNAEQEEEHAEAEGGDGDDAEGEDAHDKPAQSSAPRARGGRRSGSRNGTASGAAAVGGGVDAEGKPVITLRSLVSTKEAGVIIGKGGKNVAEVRDDTGVKAGVSKVIPGVHERILTITGNTLSTAKAYSMVAQHLLDNPVSNQQTQYADCTTVRLLVSHQLMGSIIGKGGAKIKDIQEESGAKLVISKEMLPQSTERVIEVFGLVESIKIAVYNISECIINDIERAAGTILYNPQVRLNYQGGPGPIPRTGRFDDSAPSSASAAPTSERNTRRGRGDSSGTGTGRSRPSNNDSRNNNPSSSSHNGFSATLVSSSGSSGEQTQTLSIPTDMVGCVIGKAGAFINSIRRQSGAKLRIGEAAEGASERVITIVGTPNANAKALQLLYDQLEHEKQRRMNADDGAEE
ncbi:RNA binding protein, heterogenous nuclear RNP-K like protein [Irineochytrium annulatum]|nr:RNA binding protein, heterogenous nuclear RNP-K like protein [Irineochytrium annulatum]